MKKIVAIICVLTIIFSLSACQKNKLKNLEGKNTYKYEGLVVAVPNDFYVFEEENVVTAFSDNESGKSGLIDKISFITAGADSASNYDRASITERYKSSFTDFAGMTRYDTDKAGDYDIIIISYILHNDEYDTTMSQAMVFMDTKTVIITYTSMTGGYQEDFKFSIDNIALDE